MNIGYKFIEGLNQGSKVLVGPGENVYHKNNQGYRCHLYPVCSSRLNVYDGVFVSNGVGHSNHGPQTETIATMKARTALREASRLRPSSSPRLQPLFNEVSSE